MSETGHVTPKQCSEQVNRIIKKFEDFEESFTTSIQKISDSIYGVERAGVVEGGLVLMVHDIRNDVKKIVKNNPSNKSRDRRSWTAIAIALITSVCAMIAAIYG